MGTKPRYLNLNSVQDRHELTSAYLRREGDTVLGALRIQGGKITTADRGARVEQDIYGLRGYNAAEAIVFEFDTATGSLTLVGTISAGSTITGSEFRTAESPNKRITIGEAPDDRINFYSGSADETAAGFVRVQALGSGGTQRFELDLFSGQIDSQDAASVVMLSETKDGATETVITLSADTILGLATSSGVDTTLQLLGDIALQDAFSDPPAAASGFVRLWNSGGDGLRGISVSDTWPVGPVRSFAGTGSDTAVATIFPSYETMSTDCFVSFTTRVPNAVVTLIGFLRFAGTVAGWFNGVAVIADGTTTVSTPVVVAQEANGTSATVATTLTVATPGAKTYRLRVSKGVAAGTLTIDNAYLMALVVG